MAYNFRPKHSIEEIVFFFHSMHIVKHIFYAYSQRKFENIARKIFHLGKDLEFVSKRITICVGMDGGKIDDLLI